MNKHVFLQGFQSPEVLWTALAMVLGFASMRRQMICQGVGTGKRSRTILADVRTFLRVRAHMHLQVGISGEWPGAYFAHIRFDTLMSTQMR